MICYSEKSSELSAPGCVLRVPGALLFSPLPTYVQLQGRERAPMSLRFVRDHAIGPEAVLRVYRNPDLATCEEDLDALYQRCMGAEQATFHCYGRLCVFPRRQLVFGKPYTFSGQTIEPETMESPLVTRCLEQVREIEGAGSDWRCVVNLYEHGDHFISHHRDDEASLCAGAPIYTFVFGPADRDFQVRGPDGILRNFALGHGGVCVMQGRLFQATCTHAVPRRKRVKDWRLSVTLRRAA